MAATLAQRQLLLLVRLGDTPDQLLAGLLGGLYAVRSDLDPAPVLQDAVITEAACDVLTAYYRDQLSRVLDADERATVLLRLNSLSEQRKAAVLTQATERAKGTSSAAVYRFNQDFLEPAAVD